MRKKITKPARFSRPDRRGFLASFLVLGLIARPNAMAANSSSLRHSVPLIENIFETHFFDPAWMATPEAEALSKDLLALAETTPNAEEFCRGFAEIFESTGVSHVDLSVQRRSAAQLGRHFDRMEVGASAVRLDWHGTVAKLSIQTFMGADTGPRITAAFRDITRTGATGLIIDLRDTPGGSFAMRHLVGHCILRPTDAGVLRSRIWHAANVNVPDRAHIETLAPWHGSSIVGLWRHLAQNALTRVQFLPMKPTFSGPIAILINRRTASAAELVADALRAARGAVLIGEQTAGAMLVQRPFDVGDDFTLSLPVADYVSFGSGRIEGSGLVPDLAVPAENVMSQAMSFLSETSFR